MTKERILVAESGALAENVKPLVARLDNAPDVIPISDGARCVAAYAKLLRAKQPPLLVVLDEPLERIGTSAVGQAIRAIERAFGSHPTALLFYTPDAADGSFKAMLGELGRAVHLQRPADAPIEEQAMRLTKAMARLLAQVRGK